MNEVSAGELCMGALKIISKKHARGAKITIKARSLSFSKTGNFAAERSAKELRFWVCPPVNISDGTRNWYGLGPISVLPAYQRQGIGAALVLKGLALLEGLNAQGCCLVGHPDYYRKFGFKNMAGLVHEGVPQEVFLALSFGGHMPQGIVTFHEGFKADGQQEGAGDALQST
jgi:putative acetyltransferase